MGYDCNKICDDTGGIQEAFCSTCNQNTGELVCCESANATFVKIITGKHEGRKDIKNFPLENCRYYSHLGECGDINQCESWPDDKTTPPVSS